MRSTRVPRGHWFCQAGLSGDSPWRRLWPAVVSLCCLLAALAPPNARTAYADTPPQSIHDAVITNCSNDGQLRNALSDPGTSTITFNCGAGTRTIPIGSFMSVQGNITVDGANRITLDGGDVNALLQVFNSARLTLRNLRLANGAYNGAYPIENFGRLTLFNVTVVSSQSTGQGGALYNSGTLTVNASNFLDNQGLGSLAFSTNGAAIYNDGGLAVVNNSTFRGNRVFGTIGVGGAIAVQGGDVTIRGSRFENNRAPDGGALYVNAGSTVTVTESIFAANEARFGGAIETGGELQIDYSRLSANDATVGDGGAIWVVDGDLDMTYSTLNGNTAAGNGGAIACALTNASIIHSTLNANQASGFGGGIYSECDLNLTNSTLSGNRGQGGGGAVYQAGSFRFATVGAVTIAFNTAPFGAGVYNDDTAGSSLALQATLLSGNSGGNCDGVITSNGDNASSDSCGALIAIGDRNNLALPLAPLGRYGGATATHFLPSNSPARDAIPNARCGFSVDQRDVTRPKGARCDVGAVEAFARLWVPALRR